MAYHEEPLRCSAQTPSGHPCTATIYPHINQHLCIVHDELARVEASYIARFGRLKIGKPRLAASRRFGKHRSDLYVIIAPSTGRLKIGRAVDVQKRLTELRTASSCELRLLLVAIGAGNREREVHRRFAFYRDRGEWFRVHPTLLRAAGGGMTPRGEG